MDGYRGRDPGRCAAPGRCRSVYRAAREREISGERQRAPRRFKRISRFSNRRGRNRHDRRICIHAAGLFAALGHKTRDPAACDHRAARGAQKNRGNAAGENNRRRHARITGSNERCGMMIGLIIFCCWIVSFFFNGIESGLLVDRSGAIATKCETSRAGGCAARSTVETSGTAARDCFAFHKCGRHPRPAAADAPIGPFVRIHRLFNRVGNRVSGISPSACRPPEIAFPAISVPSSGASCRHIGIRSRSCSRLCWNSAHGLGNCSCPARGETGPAFCRRAKNSNRSRPKASGKVLSPPPSAR